MIYSWLITYLDDVLLRVFGSTAMIEIGIGSFCINPPAI